MTPEQEHACYDDPDNQVPQGDAVRRGTRPAQLSTPAPDPLPEAPPAASVSRAAAEDRSPGTVADP